MASTLQADRPRRGELAAGVTRFAPFRTLVLAAVLAAFTFYDALQLATSVPWLGIDLRATHAASVVDGASGPAADELAPGQQVTAIRHPGGANVPLGSLSLLREPDTLATYDAFNRFMERQAELWRALQGDSVTLVLADRSTVEIQPAARRPAASLPLGFWLLNLCGITAFLMGIGAWSFRSSQMSTQLLLMTGLGFHLAATTASVYVTREIALDPAVFRTLAALNHLGVMTFAASIILLLWHYPSRLARPPILLAGYAAVVVVWMNETLQWVEWPIHTFYLPIAAAFPLIVLFGALQWIHTRGMPIERAAVRWFVLSVFVSMSLEMALYFIPAVMGSGPLVSLPLTFLIGLTLYAGLALGILRFRLFELERWWFRSWIWLASGVSIFVVDVLLMMVLGLTPYVSLGVAVVLVGWLYFPVRQWFWTRMTTAPRTRMEDHLPAVIETLLGARTARDYVTRWPYLLRRIFRPMDIKLVRAAEDESTVRDQGLVLRVPTLDRQAAFDLSYAHGGGRLFSHDDCRLADALLDMTRRSGDLRDAAESSARTERNRIMRDLHDDVGGRLLSLTHNARDERNAELARAALKALRDTIYSLDDQARSTLEEAVADWRAETGERLDDAGVALQWSTSGLQGSVELTPRHRINVGRVLQEAVSNALKHSVPERVEVRFSQEESRLFVHVANDGLSEAPPLERLGKGLNNIRNRARELDGDASWAAEPRDDGIWFVIEAEFCLEEST